MASIRAKIYRYNPVKDSEPYYNDYEVETDRKVTIHELLTMIHESHDGTLAYRQFKCYKGMCTTQWKGSKRVCHPGGTRSRNNIGTSCGRKSHKGSCCGF